MGRTLASLWGSDEVALMLFLGAFAAVLLLAAILLVHLVLRRRAPKPSPLFRRVRAVVLALAALELLCIGDGLIEPYWPRVTHTTLSCSKLPRGARFRLVQISDLHSEATPRLERRLPRIIAAQKPDAIAFTGDALNAREGLPVFRDCMTRLAKIAPTFAVKGNWDQYAEYKELDMYGGTGVTLLESDAAPVGVGSAQMWIAGASLWGYGWPIEGALDHVPPGAPTILLYHMPSGVSLAAKRGVDLICVGHTHGGQVVLPFYGALVTLSRSAKHYEGGLYREEKTWLYVNRGVGTQIGLPVRFLCRPEIAVIDLVGE